MIIIANSTQLDTFARHIAKQTKMKPTHIKTAIAKSQGFDHITSFEQHLDNNPLLKPDSYKLEMSTEM